MQVTNWKHGSIASIALDPPPRSHLRFYIVEYEEDECRYIVEATFDKEVAEEKLSGLKSEGKQARLWSDYYDRYYGTSFAGVEILWRCDTGEMYNWNVIGLHLWLRKAFNEYQKSREAQE